jgi:hypothetical protein
MVKLQATRAEQPGDDLTHAMVPLVGDVVLENRVRSHVGAGVVEHLRASRLEVRVPDAEQAVIPGVMSAAAYTSDSTNVASAPVAAASSRAAATA